MAKRIDSLTDEQKAQMDPWADRIHVDETSGCWEWTGGINNGYGRVYIAGKLFYAHRLTYAALVGPLPADLELDHLCRNRACCNPFHLEPVTPRENQRRGIKGVLTTHCPAGHAYTETNTLRRANGHRRCRTCHAAREAARRQRKAS